MKKLCNNMCKTMKYNKYNYDECGRREGCSESGLGGCFLLLFVARDIWRLKHEVSSITCEWCEV